MGIAEELQFVTSKLWQNISKSEETKGRSAFIGFRKKLGRVLDKS